MPLSFLIKEVVVTILSMGQLLSVLSKMSRGIVLKSELGRMNAHFPEGETRICIIYIIIKKDSLIRSIISISPGIICEAYKLLLFANPTSPLLNKGPAPLLQLPPCGLFKARSTTAVDFQRSLLIYLKQHGVLHALLVVIFQVLNRL